MTVRTRPSAARLFQVSGALSAEASSAAAAWPERRGLLLELEDRNGRTGQGEASPLPGFSIDTLAQARSELGRVAWPSIPELEVGQDLPDRLSRVLDDAGLRAPAARFAAETALLDLIGQAAGLPVHAVLRRTASESTRPVPLAALLSGDVARGGREKVGHGYGTLKLKVGRVPGEELQLLATLRAELGEGIRLRADANRSLPSATAAAWLAAASDLRLEFVEEPVGLDGLAALGRPAVSLALDESLPPGDDSMLERAMAIGGYRYLVLKPAYHGGVERCLRLAESGRSLGARPVISHLYDGPVALAAAAELALALGPGPAAGLDRHAGLSIWPAVDLPAFGRAELVYHDRPGLGLPRLADRPGGERWVEVRL